MWLFKRLTFTLMLTALTGCGFTPALAPGDSGSALPGQIEIMAPDDRNSFDVTRRLEERLGQPRDVNWDLNYTLTTDEEGVGITPEQVTTRFNIHGQVHFTVTLSGTDQQVFSGQVRNSTSYAATGSTVSTLTAERDARQRLMFILADQLYTQLLLNSDQIVQ
ncbi:LPS assembly lipoprotein LptE [Halocynthiibacter styelae]|uniref:LPS-assembly lipoprotein n=1 Tax=Halocynthiibacter styelae TaxID=2761955 RepID=A0A8J7LWT1_9RHOB|nr:LPS assembly lipoprotein LptE [Paenihalocynthiibacter styelae]MBI1494752.1 hypothetical protein [Paenihalocynthiibacter styelae]